MTGDIEAVKAYLDDKITEQERAIAGAGDRDVTDLTRVADRARQQLLRDIRNEIEWIEVEGYHPGPCGETHDADSLDALSDDYGDQQ